MLNQFGITFKRRGKEDIYGGVYKGKVRTVVVPRNKRSIPRGTLASILRQAGITREEAYEVFQKKHR
ncbi:type II toxin-antitoxin system HicA family toxin [bacterium]|nr:type II toxin-antitoxin system HicA family toxin [bacterium]